MLMIHYYSYRVIHSPNDTAMFQQDLDSLSQCMGTQVANDLQNYIYISPSVTKYFLSYLNILSLIMLSNKLRTIVLISQCYNNN